jgi:hypothetical protein
MCAVCNTVNIASAYREQARFHISMHSPVGANRLAKAVARTPL